MSRNGNRITNHYNLIEARADWQYVAARALAAGATELVAANTPAPDAGWRKIDKCIDAIRAHFGWPYPYQMRKDDASLPQDINAALGYLDGVIGSGKAAR